MANPGNVVESLRRSKKGQLKYDPRGFANLQMGSAMNFVGALFKGMIQAEALKLTKNDPNGFTNLEEELKRLENSSPECSYPTENFSEIASPSKRSKAQQMKATMNGEQTQKQIDDETKEKIIQWIKDQRDKMAARVHPFEKEIIFRYHNMMVVYSHLAEAIVHQVATREDVIMHNDVVIAFARLVYAAKTSILRSDGVTDVKSLVQEFDECIENAMDAIKCAGDPFSVCRNPQNEDRRLQKIVKYLRNPYQPFETETEENQE